MSNAAIGNAADPGPTTTAADLELLAPVEAAQAQNLSDASAGVTEAAAAQASAWWTTTNAMTMCAVLLLFGLIVMGLSTYLMKAGQSAQSILRVFGTLLVIIMATFLVVAGYTNEQLGAPLGLLGTIAGYLLGRQTTDDGRAPARTADPGS
jgi:hypothetical protein